MRIATGCGFLIRALLGGLRNRRTAALAQRLLGYFFFRAFGSDAPVTGCFGWRLL